MENPRAFWLVPILDEFEIYEVICPTVNGRKVAYLRVCGLMEYGVLPEEGTGQDKTRKKSIEERASMELERPQDYSTRTERGHKITYTR